MSSPTPSDREYAYFQASGVFDPAEITLLLGIEPDDCWAVGDDFTRRGHTRKRRSSSWKISSGLEDSQRLNDHIAALLFKLESKQPSLLKAATFVKYFGQLDGDELKTAPSGYDRNHPAIDLIRKKQFIVGRKFSDKEVADANFPKEVVRTFEAMRPFFDYMSEVLSTDINGQLLVK